MVSVHEFTVEVLASGTTLKGIHCARAGATLSAAALAGRELMVIGMNESVVVAVVLGQLAFSDLPFSS